MANQEDKRLLKMVGITYNQIESGVYAVILQEAAGTRRIPIIIGFPEAQAIECKLQEIVTPRPLTHDLMVNMMAAFGIGLKEIFIHKFPNGVFAAEMELVSDGASRMVDARSSDAIALALRTGAPIYTSAAVLDEVGFEAGQKPTPRRPARASMQPKARTKSETESGQGNDLGNDLENDLLYLPTEFLREDMARAAENEDYERAARIKEEIDRREQEHKDSDDADNQPSNP